MDGITILNTFTHTSAPSWAVGLAIGGIAVFLFGMMPMFTSQDFPQFIVGLSFFIIGAIMSICGAVFANTKAIETTRYECIIDESVNANDFYNQYNVIEKRGEIWVLEEKNNDE